MRDTGRAAQGSSGRLSGRAARGPRLRRVALLALAFVLALGLTQGAKPASAIVSCQGTFTTAGETACQIPANALTMTITAIGGAGAAGGDDGAAGAAGGNGDQVQATFTLPVNGAVAEGTLYVEVGSNGSAGVTSPSGAPANGGAGGATASGAGGGSGGIACCTSGTGGGGGGSSDVRTCAAGTCSVASAATDMRVLVAGGGGAGQSAFSTNSSGQGGNAGSNGADASAGGGSGGTTSGGGAGGAGVFCATAGTSGGAGGRGRGGSGGGLGTFGGSGGGGGGGGYFGGGQGGGAGSGPGCLDGGGGGGGADFTMAGATGVSRAPSSSLPSVTISFTCTGICVSNSSSTALVSNTDPSMAGQAVTFTATVTCDSITPTGTVSFFDGATPLGSSSVNGSGQATFSTSSLSVGSHNITAVYSGDGNCATSTSPVLTQTVNTAGSGVTLTSSQNPSAVGQSVTFTATVTCTGFTPTGTVTFFDGSTPLATVSLPPGPPAGPGPGGATPTASFTTSALASGSHSITATYNGNTNCATSTSSPLTQVVGTAGGSVTLASSANPSSPGQAVTFTATVTCTGFTPTGTVTFTIDGAPGSPVALNGSGAASFTTSSLNPGSHNVTASYSGDTNCAASTSSVLTQVVGTAAGTVTLASSANPSAQGQTLTFTATVTCPTFIATGTVTFTIDGTAGTPVTLSGGKATFTTGSPTAGSHSVTAAYGGDGNCGAATSAVLTQVVNGPAEQAVEGLAYCYPAVNAPPPGFPCTPFTGNGPLPTGAGGVGAYCQAVWPLLAQQQACIAQLLGNVGGFICPIGCARPIASTDPERAGVWPARLPGAYCALPDGARQWVAQGSPPPAGCT